MGKKKGAAAKGSRRKAQEEKAAAALAGPAKGVEVAAAPDESAPARIACEAPASPASPSLPKRAVAAAVPRAVPWASWDEWLWVFESAYAADPEARAAAVARGRTWSLRGGVPHAVESTLAIVARGLEEAPSRLGGAMLVVRCVNGLVDAGQTRQLAQPIAALAEAIRLPAWLVDLRHAATHNALPSGAVLDAAAAELLSYFYDRYWAAQRQKLRDLRANADALIVGALARKKGDVSARVCDELAKTPTATLAHVFAPALAARLRHDDRKAPLPLLRHIRHAWPAVDGALVDALAAAALDPGGDARCAATWLPILLARRAGDAANRTRGVDARRLWRRLAAAHGPAAAALADAVAALVAPDPPPQNVDRPSLEALEAHVAKKRRVEAPAAADGGAIWNPA